MDKLAAKRALTPSAKAFSTSSWRSQRPPNPSSSTLCPAGCDLRTCPKLADSCQPCDIFELSPQRAAEILKMDNNYKKAVHAVRVKNSLSGVRELAGDRAPPLAPATAPAPSPSTAPAIASSPAPAPPSKPGSRALMLQTQMDFIASQLEDVNKAEEEKGEKPAAPRFY